MIANTSDNNITLNIKDLQQMQNALCKSLHVYIYCVSRNAQNLTSSSLSSAEEDYIDLIFPHHENEIAQSEGCTGKHPFVHYWLHNGFITVNEEKMSKSLGNFFMVIDILKNFSAETLRFFIVQTHYRSPLDFSDARLQEADKSLARLRNAKNVLQELAKRMSAGSTDSSVNLQKEIVALRENFMEAMRDDFNTALAISYMFELGKKINVYKQEIGDGKPDGKLIDLMAKVFGEMCGIIGILEEQIVTENCADEKNKESALIEMLIEMRQDAKKNKNYALADKLRDDLKKIGIVLQDTPQGVKWSRE